MTPLLRRIRSSTYAAAKRVASGVAACSGLYRAAASRYGGLGVIFMLHRVMAPGRPILWPGYEVHADVLDRLLAATSRLGWEAISLDQLHRRLSGGDGGGRFACFTVDDGYADTLRVALPVFQRHRVPVGVYVTTGLVERSSFYWWGALEEVVLENDRVEWPGSPGAAPRTLAAGSWSEKRFALGVLSDLCEDAGPSATRDLLRRYRVSWEALADRDFLTKDQARSLAADPLVTIGGHGMTHLPLAQLTEASLLREMEEGRRTLEGWVDRPVRHFAYPFGAPHACGPREFALATKLAYATGVTTRRGNVFSAHRDRLTALPRREIPTNLVGLRNALTGVESVLRGWPTIHSR